MKHLALVISSLAICFSGPNYAQQTTAFPPEAKEVTGEALKALVSGKTFRAQPATGAGWKVQYRDNGYAYLDVSNGFSDSGKWRIEGTKLCSEWRRMSNSFPCNEVREMSPTTLVLLRESGELLVMKSD